MQLVPPDLIAVLIFISSLVGRDLSRCRSRTVALCNRPNSAMTPISISATAAGSGAALTLTSKLRAIPISQRALPREREGRAELRARKTSPFAQGERGPRRLARLWRLALGVSFRYGRYRFDTTARSNASEHLRRTPRYHLLEQGLTPEPWDPHGLTRRYRGRMLARHHADLTPLPSPPGAASGRQAGAARGALMAGRAPVLVHGATGFTGKLVCAALRRRGVPFAIGGRSAEKLGALAEELGGVEVARVDATDAEGLRRAIAGRAVVCACAGPFVEVGEAVLATCARAGVHYVDTTGEQAFVGMAVERYGAAAEASGACIVPAMGLEIAPADWGAHVVAGRVGGAPDAIDVCYVNRSASGEAPLTTRGTKRSIVGVVASDDARQFVDGTLVAERPASFVRRFPTRDGGSVTAASFPSPEAIVVPSHTGARTVRTFMAMGVAFPRRARCSSVAASGRRRRASSNRGPSGRSPAPPRAPTSPSARAGPSRSSWRRARRAIAWRARGSRGAIRTD